MSTTAQERPRTTSIDTVPKKKETKALWTKKEKGIVKDPLWDNNPISLQVLGICSALAVTTQVQVSLVMCLSVIFVLTLSSLVISLLRSWIPSNVRIIVMLSVISFLVIIIDEVLKAHFFSMSKQLSVFVGLIITNCIILGRAEGFALHNPPWHSFLDGLGNALGYSLVLLIVATFREVLGAGTFFGIPVIPDFIYELGYSNIGLMALPPGAFLFLGLLIWFQRHLSKKYETA